jgi:hypothetical protein
VQLHDRFGEAYWLASSAPPAGWGDAEEVSRWFVGELVFDRVDDDSLAAQLDDERVRIWRRARPIAATDRIASVVPPPLLSELVVAERTWIGWEVLDVHGRPVPGIAYELNTPDGEIRTGVTDAQGRVNERGIASGTCSIRFVSSAA